MSAILNDVPIACKRDRIEPIIRGDYPDPTIVRVGGDYYLTHSANWFAPALLIWHSTDLKEWRPLTHALADYGGDIWAPDISHYEGRFYIYFTTSGRNKVITADNIMGPWSDPIDLNVPHIDPGHLATPDGRRFLYLSGGHIVELAADGLSTIGELRKIYDGWAIPFPTRIEALAEEGPKPFYRGGWYYLVTAQGGTAGPATGHMVVVARSRTHDGPWENAPANPILRTGSRNERWWCQGHGTIFETALGEWRIVYHAYEQGFVSLGRHTLIQEIVWTDDGWPQLGETEPSASISTYPSLSDDFTGAELSWQWQFSRELDRSRYTVGDGELTLEGRGASPASGSPPLCIRPQDEAYEVEVDVEIYDDDTQAGLIFYYDETALTGLAVTGSRVIMLLRKHDETAIDAPARQATLRLVNDHHDVDYWVRIAGEEWQQIPRGNEISGWNHNALGGFLGLRAALYVSGTGKGTFRNFRYRSL